MSEDRGELGVDEEVGGYREVGARHEEAQAGAAGRSDAPGLGMFRVGKPKRTQRKKKEQVEARLKIGAQGRFLILDTWLRSKLPAKDFGAMVGVSRHTLYAWKRAFETHGPAGLEEKKRGAPRGSKVSEVARRAILRLKEDHPDWGLQRIHDVLLRSEACAVSRGAIRNVLRDAGYELEARPVKPHTTRKPRRHEAERPNQRWQTDLFSFLLKRENRRVYVVAYMDSHSRYIVGHNLSVTQSGQFVRDTFLEAVTNYGLPEVLQSDRGTQYYSPSGQSAFEALLERNGVRHKVVVDPKKNGKIERFWGTLWRELLEGAIFQGFDDARTRLAMYFGYYNFQRTHQGIGGLVPADRYFQAADAVAATLRSRVADNAYELARYGKPRKSFYLTGRVGDETVSLHGEGARVILTNAEGEQEEVNLSAQGLRSTHPSTEEESPAEAPPASTEDADGAPDDEDPPEAEDAVVAGHPLPGFEDDDRTWPPGTSPLDEGLATLREALTTGPGHQDDEPEDPVDGWTEVGDE